MRTNPRWFHKGIAQSNRGGGISCPPVSTTRASLHMSREQQRSKEIDDYLQRLGQKIVDENDEHRSDLCDGRFVRSRSDMKDYARWKTETLIDLLCDGRHLDILDGHPGHSLSDWLTNPQTPQRIADLIGYNLRDDCAMFFIVHSLGRDCAIVVNRFLQESYEPDAHGRIYDWYSPTMVLDSEFRHMRYLLSYIEMVESEIKVRQIDLTMRHFSASIGRDYTRYEGCTFEEDTELITNLRFNIASIMQLQKFQSKHMQTMQERMKMVVKWLDAWSHEKLAVQLASSAPEANTAVGVHRVVHKQPANGR